MIISTTTTSRPCLALPCAAVLGLITAAFVACSPPQEASPPPAENAPREVASDATPAPTPAATATIRGRDDSVLHRTAPSGWTYGWDDPPAGMEAIEARDETRAAFWMDATPVTAHQFTTCVDAGGCPPLPEPNAFARQHCTAYNIARGEAAVNCVTRADAEAYCTWAGRRLPSEIEWELAARGAGARVAPPGWESRPPRDSNARTLGVAAVSEGRGVWAGDASFHGIGQVREWTAGIFEPGVDSRIHMVSGQPPVATRGVAWHEDHASPLMARWMTDPTSRSPAVGFRCAVADAARDAARCPDARCRPPRVSQPLRVWGNRLETAPDDGVGARVTVPAGDVEIPLPRLVRDDERRTRVPYRVGSFRIDVTPVTVAAMRACVRAGVCVEPSRYVHGPWCTWGQVEWDNHPITCVSSGEAEAFCAWAGGRLPTEVEWLRAVFGDGLRAWPWGPEPVEGRSNLRHREESMPDPDGWPFTSPVGAFPDDRSPYGLLDGGGNVSEWVADPISPWATPQNPQQREATGVGLVMETDDIEATHRVLGLSWMHNHEDDGREYTLMTRPDTVGFRCVWDAEP